MTDQSPDLIAAVRECLWRLYGYDAGPEGVHPVTADKYERDAIVVLGSIVVAGYVVIDAERVMAWAAAVNAMSQAAQPGDLDSAPTGGG